MSFLEKITLGLKKTREALLGPVAAVFKPGRELGEEDFDTLEAALLRADVGPRTTDRILAGVRTRLRDGASTGAPLDALRAEIASVFTTGGSDVPVSGETPHPTTGASLPPFTQRREGPRPHVTLVVGVNGSGKTTTIAKLASRARERGESVLLVACDTFRAAAADQLEVWAERAGAEILRQKPGADPAAVAFDGMARAKSRAIDRVFLDTAGRLHVKVNLMEELKKIGRVIGREIPGAPHEVLLILDATTGQNGLGQAQEFRRAVGVTGIALTKLDGTAKGGIVLAIADTMGIPIRWIGVGEGMEDLIPFDAAAFAAALVGATAGEPSRSP